MPPSLLIINYHYVRAPSMYAYPGIHPLAPEAFAQQIKMMGERLHIASPAEVEAHLQNRGGLPGPSALITFDDGLVDHAIAARSVLDPMGIKAIFFVCSRPLLERRALSVHKVHWLRAMTEPARFIEEIRQKLPAEWGGMTLTEEQRQSALRTYIYDQPEHAEAKYLLNFVLPDQVVDTLTSRMLADRGVDEADFCRQNYMDREALEKLEKNGHRVGAHSHDHRPVTRMGPEEVEHLRINVKVIHDATGRRPAWFSFPYGRDWALPKNPETFCRRHGFSYGVTLTGTWVQSANVPFALDRINTNEVDRVLGSQ